MKLIEIAFDDVEFSDSAPRKKKSVKHAKKSIMDVVPKYKHNIQAVIDNKLFFYRGDSRHYSTHSDMVGGEDISWIEIEKRSTPRRSIHGTRNVLLSWVDSQWKGFPKREMSSFATQSRSHTDNFSSGHNVKMIIPADNVDKFGWCEHDFNMSPGAKKAHKILYAMKEFYRDIGYSIGGGIYTSDQFLSRLRKWFEQQGMRPWDETTTTPQNIDQQIDALDWVVKNVNKFEPKAEGQGASDDMRAIKMIKSFALEMKELEMDSLRSAAEQITPESLGAKVFNNFADVPSNTGKDDELWFEGDYLAITFLGEEDTIAALKELVK